MGSAYGIEGTLKSKIMGDIDSVINEIFRDYFGVSVIADGPVRLADSREGCLCEVNMRQEGVDMLLCFNFDSDLLHRLVDEVYGGSLVQDSDPYKDAACEIANIVCCRVKAVLNENGFSLDMDLPYSVEKGKEDINYKDSINMYFSVNDGSGFFVDLFTSG